MLCRRCKADNDDDDRYCVRCGEPLGEACPACGAAAAVADRFCSQCGAALPAAGVVDAASEPPGAATGRTALFAGFAAALDAIDLDRQAVAPLLARARQALIATVQEFGGTVCAADADGVLAVFGVAPACDDHARRACLAALAMQDEIAFALPAGGPILAVGVGLCSGDIALGEAPDGGDPGATGPAVHVAVGLGRLAAAGTVSIAESTWRLVEGQVETVPVGTVRVDGLERPLWSYRLIRRPGMPGARGPARFPRLFVGRDTELRLIAGALDEAAAGRGRVVAIVGEPGVGKTRLMEEVVARYARPDWLVLRARGSAHIGPAPFSGAIETLSGLFEADDRRDQGRLRDALVDGLRASEADLEACLPPLAALFGVRADEEWQEQPAEQKRRRIGEAVLRVLRLAGRDRPLLVAIDDLQWIDADSTDVYGLLAGRVTDLRLMLLGATRPGFGHRWHTAPTYMQVPIGGLRRDDADALLHDLLGADPELADLHATVLDSAGGNALFMEELVRSMASSGALRGRPGRYGLSEPAGVLRVPATVEGVIAERIAGLAPEDRAVLLAAATIGHEVDPRILAGVVGMTPAKLRRPLKRLDAAELLAGPPAGGRGMLAFNHALTHDAAYGSIPKADRAHLHRRVVEVVETLGDGDLAQRTEVLAFHAEQAGAWTKALRYHRQAGREALARSACQRAADAFGRALAALRHLPATAENREAALALRFGLRNALMPLGRHAEILPHLTEAEALARGLGKERELAQVHSYLAHYYWLVGDWERAIESGRLALGSAERAGDFGLAVATRFTMGLASYSIGAYAEAVGHFSRNAELLTGPLARERFGMFSLPSVVSRGWLAWSLVELGQFDAALAAAAEARQVADAIGRPFDRVQGLLALGATVLLRGDLAAGAEMLTQAYDLCQRMDVRILVPRVAAALAFAYAEQGNAHAAGWLADAALAETDNMNLAAMRTVCLRWIGEAHLRLGDVNACLDVAERMLAVCRATREAGYEAWALYLKGAALAETDEAEMAAEALDGAAALAEERGMKLLLAHIHDRRGRLVHPGRREESGAALRARAADLYREMGLGG